MSLKRNGLARANWHAANNLLFLQGLDIEIKIKKLRLQDDQTIKNLSFFEFSNSLISTRDKENVIFTHPVGIYNYIKFEQRVRSFMQLTELVLPCDSTSLVLFKTSADGVLKVNVSHGGKRAVVKVDFVEGGDNCFGSRCTLIPRSGTKFSQT